MYKVYYILVLSLNSVPRSNKTKKFRNIKIKLIYFELIKPQDI